MKKCKNIECNNDIEDKKTYCSLHCRNIYVNKHLRNYAIVSETFNKKRVNKILEYNGSPKYCIYCGNVLPYKKGIRNKFCNSSCSSTYNNLHPIKEKKFYNESSLNKLRIVAAHNFANKSEKSIVLSVMSQEYNINPNHCAICGLPLAFKYRNRKFCNINCRRINDSVRLKNYNIYKSLTNFKFDLRNYDFDFNLIKEFGWYKATNHGNNLKGISRDHIISVNFGYKEMINPLLLSHPANCKLMKHTENSSKHTKCDITLVDLINRISNFDEQYGNFYQFRLKTYITIEELNELYLIFYDKKISV